MAGFGRKDLREDAFTHLTSNLFKVDVHVISFHVLRARTAAGRHHARAGAACEKRSRSAPRACRSCARKPCLQTELLGKLFLHFILIEDVGENDLLVFWNTGDKILKVASNNKEVSCARSNV